MLIGHNLLRDLRFLSLLLIKGNLPKALYIGYVGYGNLGDEALKEAIFDLFRSTILFSESRGTVIRFYERIGLLKFNILFLGGGTLVLRSENMLKRISDDNIPKKIVFGTGVANHIFWKDVPASYGKVDDWVNALNNVFYLSVRGPISAQILKGHKVMRDIHVIGDPVLYFTREISRPKSRLKRLGVNIGYALNENKKGFMWGRDEGLFFSKFMDFIETMIIDDWQIEFIPMNKEDETLIDDLLLKDGLQKKVKVFRNYMSTQKTIDRMEGFDVFVGQKLHATILAYCANTPAVMVEYRPKCRDFMSSIDMEHFNLRTDEFNVEKCKALVDELYLDLDSIRFKSNRLCKGYKKDLIQAAQTVTDMVSSRQRASLK